MATMTKLRDRQSSSGGELVTSVDVLILHRGKILSHHDLPLHSRCGFLFFGGKKKKLRKKEEEEWLMHYCSRG